MRSVMWVVFVVLLAGCPAIDGVRPPPPERFYWPSGLVFLNEGGVDGTLFVANANFDKRYTTGSVSAVDLSRIGLPPFGSPLDGGAKAIELLGTGDAGAMSTALVSSFTGEMTSLKTAPGEYRLFVPSRSEHMKFQALGVSFANGSAAFRCVTPVGSLALDCGENAPSLSSRDKESSLTDGLPRAPTPFGATVRTRSCGSNADCPTSLTCESARCVRANGFPEAQVLVTHLSQADSPPLSGNNTHGYLVQLDAENPVVDDSKYLDLGPGATNSVVSGRNHAFVSGRYLYSGSNTIATQLVRMVSRNNEVTAANIQSSFSVADARGIALSSDEKRVYLLGRAPDVLLVLGISQTDRGIELQVIKSVPMPEGPSEVHVIARPGKSDLVGVTCSGAGSLVFFDDDVGDVVAQVPGVGSEPFEFAIDLNQGTPLVPGARLYVSNFADGRVAVIDVPDIAHPQSARVVAQLGTPQRCLVKINDVGCPP